MIYIETTMLDRITSRDGRISKILYEKIVTPYVERLEIENKKLKDSVDECLAICAHVDPDTYTNLQAVEMIKTELLKMLKELENKK